MSRATTGLISLRHWVHNICEHMVGFLIGGMGKDAALPLAVASDPLPLLTAVAIRPLRLLDVRQAVGRIALPPGLERPVLDAHVAEQIRCAVPRDLGEPVIDDRVSVDAARI